MVESNATASQLCQGIHFKFKAGDHFSLAVALPEVAVAPAPALPPVVIVMPSGDLMKADSTDAALDALSILHLVPLAALGHSNDGIGQVTPQTNSEEGCTLGFTTKIEREAVKLVMGSDLIDDDKFVPDFVSTELRELLAVTGQVRGCFQAC